MIDATKIQDALVQDAIDNVKSDLGLKTIVSHEPKYDKQTLQQLMPLAPFLLIRYAGLKPVESERLANGASGMNRQLFSLVVGATSVRGSKEARDSAVGIIDGLRRQYDGYSLAVPDEGNVQFAIESEDFLDSDGNVVAYYAVYSIVQN